MAQSVLYPHITDLLAAEHPEWVIWSDQHGWLPRVAGGATEDPPADPPEGEPDDPDEDDVDDPANEAKTLSQADVDAILNKRLGQAKKAWEKEQSDAAEKAKMNEAERLKAEKAEAEKAAADQVTAANSRVIRAEAKVAAVAAGVKADRAAAFLRIADLADIELDDDGEPDTAAIKAAVEKTLKEFPEFKGTTKSGASGSEHGEPPKERPTGLAAATAAHYA